MLFLKNILCGSNGNVMEGPNRYCQPRRTAVRFFLWGSLWHHCDKSMNGTSWYIPKKNKAVVNLTPCLHGKKQWTLQQAMFDCERVANVVKPIANHPINYPWLGGIKNLIPVIVFFFPDIPNALNLYWGWFFWLSSFPIIIHKPIWYNIIQD